MPLIIFAMVEIHEFDRVIRQFGYTQRIPLPPEELDDLQKFNLWGRLEEYWSIFHKKYIKIWHNGKQHLLLATKKSMKCRHRRPRRGPINLRLGEHVMGVGSTSILAPHDDLIVVQPIGKCIFYTTITHSTILHANSTSDTDLSIFTENSHINCYAIWLCDTMVSIANSVANTRNIVILLRWVILATAESHRGDER
ncbi:hypothetical protein Goari_022911 [Gossypium aridum]|uniref:Uncharacterized protein n=1 Tax=Gossypium aridum TaxID=34290 RepID=A0A7J8YVQ8_GOSAI|nr:hypothetical protein [Gossypium aridum]